VHYHPGKVNVFADTLSRKPHYNYLPAVRSTREEFITRVLPDLSLFNIALTPTLRSEIIGAQKGDEGEKPSGQYIGLICDESLTCRGLNLNSGHFSGFTFTIYLCSCGESCLLVS
jgi:hypothetical protein